jgi:hypothetical protein
VIDTNANWVGRGVNISANTNYNNIQTTGGFYASGGSSTGYSITVGSTNLVSNSGSIFPTGILEPSSASSTIYVGSGNFYARYTGSASTSVSCSGVVSAWEGVTSDDYVVYCINGSRYRAALSSF